MEARKRYTVAWAARERNFKKHFDTLEEADACYNRVLESPRLRVAKLMDNADFLHPVTLKSELRVRR